jgi:hypothetical protein
MQDIDAAEGQSKIVGWPADKAEQVSRIQYEDEALPVDDHFGSAAAKANPVLDAVFEPVQFDVYQQWRTAGLVCICVGPDDHDGLCLRR